MKIEFLTNSRFLQLKFGLIFLNVANQHNFLSK